MRVNQAGMPSRERNMAPERDAANSISINC